MNRTLVVSLALATATGCLHTPPIHPTAIQSNTDCARKLEARDLESAEVFCDRALEFSPQYPEAWVNKGIISYYRGKKAEAKEQFIKAVRLNNECAQAYNDLGILAMEEGKHGEAEERFRRALQVNPDYPEARYNLALDYAAAHQLERARKELKTLTTVRPNLADPWNFLGVVRLEQGAPSEAVEHFRQALLLEPRRASYWTGLGVAYARIYRYDDAEYAFQS